MERLDTGELHFLMYQNVFGFIFERHVIEFEF